MIYWSRQIIGLVLGFIWGQVPFHVFVGIFLFGGLSAGIIYVWFTAVQGIDEVEYGRAWELTEEGFLSRAVGSFVTKIIAFTWARCKEETWSYQVNAISMSTLY